MSWPLVEIEGVIEVLRNGASIKQSDGASGTPITRIETIANWEINPNKFGFADVSSNEYSNHLLQSGDILISHINSEKHLGKCAIVETELGDVIHGMNLLLLRVNKRLAFPKYIYQAICTPDFRKQLPKITKNSVNQSSFNTSAFRELKIPLPPLAEQKRIAAILDKADAIRRKREEATQLTDTLLKSVFLDMFGDPVTNPKGWEKKPLASHISLTGGYAFKSSDYLNSGLPLVRIGNANKGKFDANNLVYLPTEFATKYQKFILSPGDMLITLTGTVGKEDYGNLSIVPSLHNKWLLNQRVAKINIESDELTSSYLKFFLSSKDIKEKIIGLSRGVRQANIKNEDILTLQIPLPPKEDQMRFAHTRKLILRILGNYSHSSVSSEAFIASLTQRAFRGELTASNLTQIETEIEAAE